MGKRIINTTIESSRLFEKIELKKTIIETFTDRDEPFTRFKEIYLNYFNDSSLPQVMQYCGIGGVGKSTLIKAKLIPYIESLNSSEKDNLHPYSYFDFSGIKTKVDFFRMLIMDLSERYRFPFPYTQMALMKIASLEGDDGKANDMKEFMASCFPLKSFLKDNEILGIFSSVSTPLYMAWAATSLVAGYFGTNISERIKEKMAKNDAVKLSILHSEDAEELKSKLQYYLATDFQIVLEDISHPLVIFLDTYEDYIKTGTTINDEWLRNRSGNIGLLNIDTASDVLWVIAGRNKLSGIDRSATDSWSSYLNEHRLEECLLGGLSWFDSNLYFDKIGIQNEALRKHIFSIACEDSRNLDSGALPVIFDISYDIYMSLSGNPEKQSNLSNYGTSKESLVKRYLEQDMPTNNRDIALALSHLSWWTDDEVHELNLDVKLSDYEDFLKHSFIFKNPDGSYHMHAVIRNIIREYAIANYPKQRQIVLSSAKEYLKKFHSCRELTEYLNISLELCSSNDERISVFYNEYKHAKFNLKFANDEKKIEERQNLLTVFPKNLCFEIELEKLNVNFFSFRSIKNYDLALEVCDKAVELILSQNLNSFTPQCLFANWKLLMAKTLYDKTDYEKSKDCYEAIIKDYDSGFRGIIADDIEATKALSYYANQCQKALQGIGDCLLEMKKYEEAIITYETIPAKYSNGLFSVNLYRKIVVCSIDGKLWNKAFQYADSFDKALKFDRIMSEYDKMRASGDLFENGQLHHTILHTLNELLLDKKLIMTVYKEKGDTELCNNVSQEIKKIIEMLNFKSALGERMK